MSLLLVAHGTRKPGGVAMIADLAGRVGLLLHQPVRVAFVDVLGPNPGEVLADMAGNGEAAVVVPAFLSRGYHVGTDLPAHVAVSGHPNVTVSAPLGPGPGVVRILARRLVESGWQPGDAVVLAAAGSSDPLARTDLRWTAQLLSALVGSKVELAFAATGEPAVADAVAALRGRGARRVLIASYLLADGLFQQRLRDSGADRVCGPLGTHPGIVRLIARRFSRPHWPGCSMFFRDGEQDGGILQRAERVDRVGHHQ